MEDLSAMSQVEPNLDMRIAIFVHRELVDIEEDPPAQLNYHQARFLGTVERGQVI